MNLQRDQFLGYSYRVMERPYYGRFLYKIAFRGASVYGHTLNPDRIAELQRYQELHALIRERANDICSAAGFRCRQDNTLNVYCTHTAHAQDLLKEFSDHVISISGPLDTVHELRAIQQPRMIVRPRMWHNRFRYRLVLSLERSLREPFSRLLEDLVMGVDYEINQTLEMFVLDQRHWSSGEKILYCSDQGLIMMISLLCTDAIRKVDKVVTHNELSKQEEITEKDA